MRYSSVGGLLSTSGRALAGLLADRFGAPVVGVASLTLSLVGTLSLIGLEAWPSRLLAYAYVAFIFLPLLFVAKFYSGDPNIIPTAGVLTLAIFGGLSAGVLVTKKDFSFMGPIISMVSFILFGVIICAALFGTGLGLWFAFAVVALASGAILYNTSALLYQYRTDQHVAASLALFASVALMFWYMVQLVMSVTRR